MITAKALAHLGMSQKIKSRPLKETPESPDQRELF